MSQNNKITVYEKMKEWIKSENASALDFDENTEIFNSRILDSIQMLSFVLFVEELIGEQIPEEKLVPENFGTLSTIYREFFI